MIKRNTVQRNLVLEAVNNLKNHPTVDEVYETVIKTYPNISKGTVYRNLNQLAEESIINRIKVPGAAERFDHQTHCHYHLKCLECGFMYDIDIKNNLDLNEHIQIPNGFKLDGYEIMFKGFCPKCIKKIQ